MNALQEANPTLDVGETHRAVERLLGYAVSRDSVSSCLSTGARAVPPRFERVARADISSHGLAEGVTAPGVTPEPVSGAFSLCS